MNDILASAFRRLACATMLQLQMSQFEIQVLSVQNFRPRAYIFMLIMISWLILTSFKINAKCLWVSIPASLKTCTESVQAVQNLKLHAQNLQYFGSESWHSWYISQTKCLCQLLARSIQPFRKNTKLWQKYTKAQLILCWHSIEWTKILWTLERYF